MGGSVGDGVNDGEGVNVIVGVLLIVGVKVTVRVKLGAKVGVIVTVAVGSRAGDGLLEQPEDIVRRRSETLNAWALEIPITP